jgi:hypothetical protein
MIDLVVELCFFLRSRWRVWLRPIIIFLLVIGGLLMLSNGFLATVSPGPTDDTLTPFSRNDYRHDDAFFNR